MLYLGRSKKFFLIEGSICSILGILALAWPMISSLAIEIFFGSALLLAGIFQLARLIKVKNMPGNILGILLSILYLIAGSIFLTHPQAGLSTLTLFLAILFLVQAAMQFFISFHMQSYPYKSWNLFAGTVSLILSIIIFMGWPKDSIWILGLLAGVNLTFIGISHVIIGISIKENKL